MIRSNTYFKESQLQFLKNFNELPVSEHIRRAVDRYIDDLQAKRVSSSQSKKVGDK